MRKKRLSPLQAMRACCLDCSETAADVRTCECADCALHPYRMGHTPAQGRSRPLKAIRAYCVACADGNAKYITWCCCDGAHSTRCELWPFRFGARPETVLAKRGPLLVTPGQMPSEDVNLDDLPTYPKKRLP